MTFKKALERLYLGIYSPNEMANYYDLVLKALERLEELEKENQELKDLLKLIVNRGSVVLGNKLYGREVCFLGINERYIISKEQYEILDELRTDVIIKAKE